MHEVNTTLESPLAALVQFLGQVAGVPEFRHDPIPLVASHHAFDPRIDVLIVGIHDEPCPVFANSQIFGPGELDEERAFHRAALAHEALEPLTTPL